MPDTMQVIVEAATVKHRARALLRDIEALLTDKGLTEEQTKPLRALHDRLKAKWSDLTASEPTAESLAVEAAAVLAQDDSFDSIRCAVQAALMQRYPWPAGYDDIGCMSMPSRPWIRDIYDDVVVYQVGEDLYRCDYTINDDESVTLGPPVEVEVAYVLAPDADDGDLPTTSVTIASESDDTVTEAAPTKTVGGQKFPKSDWAYTPSDMPTTWKLRLTAKPGGDPDPGMVGAATAALGPGYRGQKVDLPADSVAGVKAKVRSAWKKANPDKSADDMPDGIKESDAPTAESIAEAELSGDIVPLIEKAVRTDGTMRIKLIQPGWGSSAYYSEAVLKRDGPKVFPSGTQMFWDHQTATEEAERPEGSLRDLAAVFTSDAAWDDDGPSGKGLYADATAIDGWRDAIEGLAPHIGTSIRSWGRTVEGEAEGQKGPILQAFTSGRSVDFVTRAGAGGEIVQLFEAARSRPTPREGGSPVTGTETMNTEQARVLREAMAGVESQLSEANRTIARLNEQLVLRDARDLIGEILSEAEIPDLTRRRLADDLIKRPALKEGALDREAMTTLIHEAVKAEQTYLAQVVGPNGRIVGMGSPGEISPAYREQAEKSLAGGLGRLGLSEAAATTAARGR